MMAKQKNPENTGKAKQSFKDENLREMERQTKGRTDKQTMNDFKNIPHIPKTSDRQTKRCIEIFLGFS